MWTADIGLVHVYNMEGLYYVIRDGIPYVELESIAQNQEIWKLFWAFVSCDQNLVEMGANDSGFTMLMRTSMKERKIEWDSSSAARCTVIKLMLVLAVVVA